MDAELFWLATYFEYSEHWISYAIVFMCVTTGWVMTAGSDSSSAELDA